METLGSILKKLRASRDITQEQFASALNERFSTKISKSMVSKWENDKEMPRLDFLRFAASYFNESLDYILGITNTPKIIRIPVLGRVQAGIPIEAVEDIIDYEEIPSEMAKTGDYFGLKVKGDSMEPKFSEGDVVIVKKQPDVESGQIGIVIVNGTDATIKRVIKHDEGGISLIALNPVYPPKFYTKNEIINMPLSIIGRVVELRSKL
jgi:repressor LexA